MPVDTSIYANATPQPVNPLALAGQVAGFQNAQNQNRLFQQEFGANKAYGDIIQQSTDPTTGVTDFAKANALAAGNPATAFKAPQYAQQAIERERAQTGLSKEQLDNANTHFQTLADRFGTLAANPNLTYKDFISTGGDLIAQGMSKPQDVVQALQSLPPNATPQQLQAAAKNFQLQALHGSERVQAMYGSPQVINSGGKQQIVAASPMMGTTTAISPQITNTPAPANVDVGGSIKPTSGGVQIAPDIQKSLDPETLSRPFTYFDKPSNQMKTETLGEFLQKQGIQSGSGAPAGGLGTGRLNPSSGGVAAEPALGSRAAADVAATGSAKANNDLHDAIANSGTRLYQLQTGLQALQGTTTGKGSQTPQDIQSFISTIAPETAKSIGIDPNKIANYDEANKYLTAYAMNQAGTLGEGTDSKLATALTSNASTHISNMAAQDVVKANIGLERMKQAQAQAFDNSGLPPEDFNKWQVGWNKTIDPRAFIVDQMSPEQYTKMTSSLTTPQAKANFANSLRNAIKGGFVSLPGATNAGQ